MTSQLHPTDPLRRTISGCSPQDVLHACLRFVPGLLLAPLLALLLGLALTPVFAQSLAAGAGASRAPDLGVQHARADLISSRDAAVPGQSLWIALRLRHDPQWHTYWKNPGDSGLATQFELSLPPGLVAGPIVWPRPHRLFIPPLANYGYEGELALSRQVQVPADFKGDRLPVRAKASWLVCKDVCIPGEAELSLELPVRASAAGTGAQSELIERMLSLEPREPLPVQALAGPGVLQLVLPAAQARARKAEFYAEHEDVLVHSAAQTLKRGPDGRVWLELALNPDRQHDWKTGPQKAAGVIDLDGRVYQVVPAAAGAGQQPVLEGAQVISTLAGAAGSAAPSPVSPVGSASESSFPASGLLAALLGAVLGGLILNLMPCVFPVIGLKLLSFAGHGGAGHALDAQARQRLRRESLAFVAGVIVSFLLLGALLLSLRLAGQAVGWGFQLQSPLFVAAMCLLFVALGLNFAGVFEWGLALTRLGNVDPALDRSARGHGLAGTFASGVLAVLVATPCTAPFMGSALGFSLAQPPLVAMLVFLGLGLGMGLPYLLLALFPAWLRHLPRPGRWMETLRQLLSFPMFAAAVWLLWVYGLQTSMDGVLRLCLGAVALALALWVYGRILQTGHSIGAIRRMMAAGVMLVVLAAAAWAVLGVRDELPSQTAPAPANRSDAAVPWQPWSEQAVQQAREQGRTVFVDFTAAWCVSCQANKKLVLDSDPVRQAFARQSVLALRADWTRQDPLISAALARHGRSGVPLYLVYQPGRDAPVILPELLTQSQVLAAIGATLR